MIIFYVSKNGLGTVDATGSKTDIALNFMELTS